MKGNGLMTYISLNSLNVFVRGVNIFLGIYGRKKNIQNIPEGSCPWIPLEGTYFRNQSPFILDPHLCKTAKFESRYAFVSIAHPWTVQFT